MPLLVFFPMERKIMIGGYLLNKKKMCNFVKNKR